MSTLSKTEDFLAELVHLQKLRQLLPDDGHHAPMVTGFLLKAQAVQKWNSQDIVALLEKTQELNFSPGMSSQLKDEGFQQPSFARMKEAKASCGEQKERQFGF